MSIATELGDGGQTSLPRGARVSKADIRVDAYGTIDELISSLGLARANTAIPEIAGLIKSIQRDLFKVSSAVGAASTSPPAKEEVDDAMIDQLTAAVHRMESTEGLLADWSLPGENAASAAYEVARTVCRRAERLVVGVSDAGFKVEANALRYLNRLSDLLWLCGRAIELDQGIDSRLRQDGNPGSRWSRAW